MAMKDIVLRNKRWPSMPIHRDIDRLFNGFFEDFGLSSSWFGKGSFTSFAPKLNVSEDDKSVEISAELPGMSEKDIEVSLDNNVLKIKGEKKVESENQEKSYYHMERSYGSFQRSIRVSDEVEPDKIAASFKDGVLVINLPKSEKEPARVIEVTSV